MRRVFLALLLVPLGAVAALAVGAGKPDPAPLTLRLPDLPRGYLVGDDSGCGALGTEGAPPELARLASEHRPEGCERQFESLYAPGGWPPLAYSAAVTFETGEAADQGFGLGRQLLTFSRL